MNALGKALIIGAAAGVGYAIVRGIRTAAAAEAERLPNGNEPTRPDLTAEPDQSEQPRPAGPDAGSSEPPRPRPGSSAPAGSDSGSEPPRPRPDSSAPAGPAPSPPGPKGKQRARVPPPITRSTHDKRTGHVYQSPESLLQQARREIPELTLSEYTAGRMIASEHYRGTPTEWAAILDSELNRAPKNLERLTAHIAPLGIYGYQGKGKRKVATTRDPARVHIETARRVLSGELRGIARGSVRFFDPRSQAAAHRKWITGESERQHCTPAIILQRWSFGHDWADKAACTLNTAKTGRLLEWVGPIDGIDPLRLMLFRRSRGGSVHQQQYDAALSLLRGAGLA